VNGILGRMADSDPGAKRGLALTDTAGNGTWQYSVNNGATWLDVGDVSNSSVLLRNTDRVRFIPAPGWTGTASLTFAAWDQTAGVAGDRLAGPSDSLSSTTLTATLLVK
jgi:hypothetical protein